MCPLDLDVDVTSSKSESVSSPSTLDTPHRLWHDPCELCFMSVTFTMVCTVSGTKLSRDEMPDKCLLVGRMTWRETHNPFQLALGFSKRKTKG